jgi:hypothetical protein
MSIEEVPAGDGLRFVGPFRHHDVVLNGWRVPYLSAAPVNGGRVHITLDSRFGIDLTVEEAERVVPFLADCIAVALGYTGHPGQDGLDEPRPRQSIVRMAGL